MNLFAVARMNRALAALPRATPFRRCLSFAAINKPLQLRVAYSPATTTIQVLPCLMNRTYHSSTPSLKEKKDKKKGGGKGGNNDNDNDEDATPVKLPVLKDLEQSMDKKIARFTEEMSKILPGRANADILNNVTVDVSGSKMSVVELGQVTMKAPNKLTVSVFDPSTTSVVASAIRDSGLGITVSTEGNNTINCSVPKPSQEARENQAKSVHRAAEKTKLDVRNVRKDGMDTLKKAKNAVSEDFTRKLGKDIDTLTEKKIEKISKLAKDKETEIMSQSVRDK